MSEWTVCKAYTASKEFAYTEKKQFSARACASQAVGYVHLAVMMLMVPHMRVEGTVNACREELNSSGQNQHQNGAIPR